MNLRATLGAALGAISIMSGQAQAVQFWLAGEDPVVQADKHKSDPADFMELFRPDAPWQHAASRLAVFKISTQLVLRGSEADLSTVFADLRRRGIALAMEAPMLRTDRGCGGGEGYMPGGVLDHAMSRIQHLGGRLDYLAMDEVVFFGREKTWADQKDQLRRCHDTVEELAHEVSQNAALIHQYFPQAKIGAIEPIADRIPLGQLVSDYLVFADRYHSESGSGLAFLHVDISWHSNWQPAIAPLKAGLHARGIRFGVIINGDSGSKDSATWTSTALGRLAIIAADSATAPEDVIIQSWHPLPTQMLPEVLPGSSTWLLLQAEIAHH
jgi:hypothetical protein